MTTALDIISLLNEGFPDPKEIGDVTLDHLKSIASKVKEVDFDADKNKMDLRTKDGWLIDINLDTRSVMLYSKLDNEWYNT